MRSSNAPLSEAAVAVLRAITITPVRAGAVQIACYHAKMNSGKLDRPVYDEVNEVLTRLGGKWQGGKAQAHLFPAEVDPTCLLDAVIGSEEMPDKNPHAFFPTPQDVVRQMIGYAVIGPGAFPAGYRPRFLEPSAGRGALAEAMGITVNLVAVNHWATAIETHTANHPGDKHYCEDLETLNPRHAVPGGHLHLLVASPECTHHSNARGGKPMSDQSRATAWHILRWADALHIDNILVENVREFRDWGPLHGCTCGLGDEENIYGPHTKACKKNRPIVAMKGRLYRQFLSGLRALGYTVSEKILNAADFGDATTRQRLFIQARRGSKRPEWPAQTHMKPVPPGGLPGLMDDYQTWRPAREIIDWDYKTQSIYSRKKQLAPATMARIMAGLRKYSGLPFIVPQFSSQGPRDIERPIGTITTQSRGVGLAEPYLVKFYGGHSAASLNEPLGTVTSNYEHFGLAEPFLVGAGGPSGSAEPASIHDPLGTVLTENHRGIVQPYLVILQNNRDGQSLDKPLPTALTSGAHFGLAEPFLVVNRTHSDARSLDDPIPTLTTGGNMGLAEAFIVPVTHQGGPERVHDIDSPLPTITGAHRSELAICEPFLTSMEHSSEGHDRRCYDTERPLTTITSKGMFGLVEPYLTEFHGGAGGDKRVRSIDDPLCTLDTSNRVGLAEPFLISYYGQGGPVSIDEPLDTITARDRFALVDPQLVIDGMIDKGEVVGWLDIRFRMLQPRELSRAMSFPEDYYFAGNREAKVKQIGNSVAVGVAKALCTTILKGLIA